MRIFNAVSILQLAAVILVSVTLTACANTGFEKKNNYSDFSQSSMTSGMAMKHEQDCPCCKSGQCPMMKKASMDHAEHQTPKGDNAYAVVMDKMHQSMMIEGTGDADVDFMRSMIPHHQGAIDMAKIALEKGKDPIVRKLAQEIIKAQEREISLMQNWLTTNIEP